MRFDLAWRGKAGRSPARPGAARQGEDIMSEVIDTKRLLVDLKASLGTAYTTACDALTKLDALPVSPDVYEQIHETYGRHFAEINIAYQEHGVVYYPVRKNGVPTFRPVVKDEPYVTPNYAIGYGSTPFPRLILRPAKRIVFVEDPEGAYVESGVALVLRHGSIHKTETRYRREGTP